MALVRYGPLVSQISGSIQGCTFQQGPAGPTLRKRPHPHARSSARANVAALQIAEAAKLWAAADEADQLRWYALSRLSPRLNRLGIPSYLTARQTYISWAVPQVLGTALPTPGDAYPTTPSVVGTFFCNYDLADLACQLVDATGSGTLLVAIKGATSIDTITRTRHQWYLLNPRSISSGSFGSYLSRWTAILGSLQVGQRIYLSARIRKSDTLWSAPAVRTGLISS